MEIFNIKDLSFQYPDTSELVLNRLTVTIQEGEFVVICGPTGCGKSTLLRLLKKELAPYGDVSGEILYAGRTIHDWDDRVSVEEIGFIFQNPENQIVMDDVLQEMVFGLENLGYSNLEMRKRVAEIVYTFGYEHLLHKKTSELSGGQKQILNLLSVLLLKPKVLLLDEPISQLDPIMAKDLLRILERVNSELGMTILLVEHRLEELFDLADRVVMLDGGNISYNGSSREVIYSVFQDKDKHFLSYLPAVSRFYLETESLVEVGSIPLNVKDCKTWISSKDIEFSNHDNQFRNQLVMHDLKPIIELNDIYYQYDKDSPMALQNLALKINQGEFYGVVGGNGSGKTTLLRICLGLLEPQRGKVKVFGKRMTKKVKKAIYSKIAYLPQNPLTYFIHDSIEQEMRQSVQLLDPAQAAERIEEQLQLFGIEYLRDRHPNDCSGGEIQKAALACMLLKNPDILLIDEPTKGLDPISKRQLASTLKRIHQEGLTIVMVTHDIEFAVHHTTKSAMMFNGNITIDAVPEELFKGNYFYTTTMNRVTQNTSVPEVLTLEEAISIWKESKLRTS
ncbi:ATP-binding cassette domain-containing protein [Ornithinibacillus sp. BX22]|uniref:ATP-binding cassette domain-containing protein n=1 Tax=Ornithinibacillus hominis TaxID=2763055 RepID=A0A923L5I4_9BACI|nr:energy-coupling factor transporter ATPase [Ornithinibacillus hominis]MBC5636760.1 ATP-binding cassette domain-containing protein [Ornithinibacillus hominis]